MVSECIIQMINYFGDDVKRINHAIKVYGFSKAIGCAEKVQNKEQLIVELTGILHDIGIREAERKYGSSEAKYQHIEGPPAAKQLLQKIGAESSVIDRVCFIIGNHHNYNKIDGIDFQILVEADFLVNIFEDGMGKDVTRSIKDKYFKTITGMKMVAGMYGLF